LKIGNLALQLSIIVTNYKTSDLLKICLKSITIAGVGLDCEIIIVDSEAEDETREVIQENFSDQKINYIAFGTNQGYAKLVNYALARAQGQYILVLNADMVLLKDSIKKMIEYMQVNSKIGVLGPQLLNFNETIQESCFQYYRLITIFCRRTVLGKLKFGQKELSRFLMKDFDHQSVREVDWIMGTALMVSRQALEQVGPMDEKFFMYFEDTDWCRRFWQAGWRVVYFPEAKMYHYHGRVSKKTGGLLDLLINKYTWIHISSALKYFFKYRFQTQFEKK